MILHLLIPYNWLSILSNVFVPYAVLCLSIYPLIIILTMLFGCKLRTHPMFSPKWHCYLWFLFKVYSCQLPVWPYCTCARFFPPEEGSRWLWCHLVMSLIFCLCRQWGVYKGQHAQAGGWLSGSFGSCTSILPLEKPPTLCPGYFGTSWGVRVQLTGKCSSFVQLHVPKVILGTLH